MHKHQLIARPSRQLSAKELQERLADELAPRLLALKPQTLKLTICWPGRPPLSVIPFKRGPLVMVSVWDEEDRPCGAFAEPLRMLDEAPAAYRVEEALPVAYRRDWPVGQWTPGAELLTLFCRRPGMSDEAFFRAWHGGHTPLSLEIHPLWCYIRNVVTEAALPHSPPLDGIVEEHVRQRADLLDPRRFFGGALRMLPNMLRVGLDVSRFIDLRRIETYLVKELYLAG